VLTNARCCSCCTSPCQSLQSVCVRLTQSALTPLFGSAGSKLGDCCTYFWCFYCALCQETRTLWLNNVERGVWNGKTMAVSPAGRWLHKWGLGYRRVRTMRAAASHTAMLRPAYVRLLVRRVFSGWRLDECFECFMEDCYDVGCVARRAGGVSAARSL
jgi:hypothetical protein